MGIQSQKKIVIDTDPGIDDAMAILMALEAKDLLVMGLTIVHGNVGVDEGAKNAVRIVEMANQGHIPVAVGKNENFLGEPAIKAANFVHGDNGMGNVILPDPEGSPVDTTAVDFLVNAGIQHPGEVYVLAVGPLTNVALALKKHPEVAKLWAGIVCMGGAYAMNGNVNPAAEANILSDPAAADYVFEKGLNVTAIGLDVTTKCWITHEDLEGLKQKGKYGLFLHSIAQFYLNYYSKVYRGGGIVPHDAIALLALVSEELFEFHEGAVVVTTEGPTCGHTLLDSGWKKWTCPTVWSERPKVKVALKVKHEKAMETFYRMLCGH